MNKYLWMAVTPDKYELPLAVADTAEQLGAIYGVKKNSVINCASRQRSGKLSGYKFTKVRIDDE